MMKLLLVDDEHYVINHLSSLLQRIDCCEVNILKTHSGPQALEIISSSHIDIAFLDINMPQVNGLMIAKKLHDRWPDCRIIFLTAYDVFDYIYEANRYPGAIYLLKTESDAKILQVAVSCCHAILQKKQEQCHLNDMQKKERQLLLLQEQQLLREILRGNPTDNWELFAQNVALETHFSFQRKVYLMLMHIKKSPTSHCEFSFYLDKMDQLLGNLFHFSFVETQNGFLFWIFQEKNTEQPEFSSFHCLKDMMDSFLDICGTCKHQTLALCLYQEKVTWEHLSHAYQLLYNSYYSESVLPSLHTSAARIIENPVSDLSVAFDNSLTSVSVPTSLSAVLSSMRQALYRGSRDQFLNDLSVCRQHCTAIKSMHHVQAIKIYSSIALICLDFIQHNGLESRLAMEIALYPLYNLNDFTDWKHAFSYLHRLAECIFSLVSKSTHDKNQLLITAIQNYIQEHLSENLNLTVIADYVNYNESYVSRLFKRLTGQNLSEYITDQRMKAAKALLEQTEDTVANISLKIGFHSSQYFSSIFRKNTGLSPNEYRTQKRKPVS